VVLGQLGKQPSLNTAKEHIFLKISQVMTFLFMSTFHVSWQKKKKKKKKIGSLQARLAVSVGVESSQRF
jgi:hypothetical protein